MTERDLERFLLRVALPRVRLGLYVTKRLEVRQAGGARGRQRRTATRGAGPRTARAGGFVGLSVAPPPCATTTFPRG
jgi:hypothetical protein